MENNIIEEIKEKAPLVDIISQYVELKPSGSSFKGKSPFSNEKTPSFFVSPEKNLWYCFSTQKGGNVFNFIQEIEGVDFKEALKILADKVGVDLTKNRFSKGNDSKKYIDILENVTKFFENNLKEEHIKYLKSRSLTEDTIKKWRIGYAKDEWTSLLDFLKDKGYNVSDIEKVGLIKRKEKGNGYYDRFRNRIMFPIWDQNGNIVAYSGRIIVDSKEAKYINSPETLFYKKKDILFGFHTAKNEIRKNNFSILVEGQFDVILAHQSGYQNTVALSGTSFSVDSLKKLNNLSNNIVFALDSDAAGMTASLKIAKIALSLGMNIKNIELKEGEDPADIISRNKENWVERIKESKSFISFLVNYLNEKSKDGHTFGSILYKDVIPLLAVIKNPIEKGQSIKEVAEKIGIDQKYIEESIEHYNTTEINTPKPIIWNNKKEENKNKDFKNIKDALAIFHHSLVLLLKKEQTINKGIVDKKEDIYEYYNYRPETNESLSELFFENIKVSNVENLKECLNDSFKKIYINMLENQLEKAIINVDKANSKEEKELAVQSFQQLEAELQKLRV